MKMPDDPKNGRKLARGLSLLMFAFMSAVSVVVLCTQDQINGIDYLFIVGAPSVMVGLGYFVGLHHDPNASD